MSQFLKALRKSPALFFSESSNLPTVPNSSDKNLYRLAVSHANLSQSLGICGIAPSRCFSGFANSVPFSRGPDVGSPSISVRGRKSMGSAVGELGPLPSFSAAAHLLAQNCRSLGRNPNLIGRIQATRRGAEAPCFHYGSQIRR